MARTYRLTPRQIPDRLRASVRRLIRDERGVTSLMSLVAVLVFTMLLVMLTNLVRHVDDKVRMQNAADAAAYSGATMLARGMNAIAFTNHLQAETLALTAMCRVLDQRGHQGARQLVPLLEYILGPQSQSSSRQPPQGGGGGASPTASLITLYQRDVVREVPMMAQMVTHEIAARHGLPQGKLPAGTFSARSVAHALGGTRGPQAAALWKVTGQPLAMNNELDPLSRTLPVLDVNPDSFDLMGSPEAVIRTDEARSLRNRISRTAVEALIALLRGTQYDVQGLAGDVRRELTHVLEAEYPDTCLPMLLRQAGNDQSHAWRDYSVIGVVYRAHDREHGPRLFVNPLARQSDAMTFAQAEFFLPRPRYRCCPWMFTHVDEDGNVTYSYHMDPWSTNMNMFNQMWSVRLTPADMASVLPILQSVPPLMDLSVRPMPLQGVTPLDLERINTH